MGAKRPESLLSKYNQTHISIQIEVFNSKNDKSSPALLWKLGLGRSAFKNAGGGVKECILAFFQIDAYLYDVKEWDEILDAIMGQ